MADINYTLTKKNDDYFIQNNEVEAVNYEIRDIDPCTQDDLVGVGIIEIGATEQIKFPKDGLYKVVLTGSIDPGKESEITFNYYLTLQLSMIESIFTSLCPCDCGCEDCIDLSVKSYEILLTTKSKIDVFKYLTSPRYDAFFKEVHFETSCLVNPQVYCDIAVEGISGTIEYNANVAKQLIALDYLAMYFAELKGLTDQEDIDYIKEKFQAESILCCINKLGIDIREIETLINDMAVITINAGAYVNQPPSTVGDNTLATTNRTVYTFTMADFTTNTTPPYADPEGDAADAVRIDSLPQDGELQLNGTAVSAGDIITKVDIDNSLLTFVPVDQDAADVDTFNFSVRDTGSGQFSN